MPIQVVEKEERLTYKNEGSKIFYRRVPSAKRNFVIKKHTKRGVTDWGEVAKELLEWAILGWEKVQLKGKDIPFDADTIGVLPEDVRADIVELTGAAVPEGDELLKNSETSSSGK